MARTLNEDLGHEVVFLQEDAVNAGEVLNVASGCDVMFWTRTWGLRGIERVLDILEQRGVPTVSYHLDLYFHLGREKDMRSDPFWRTKYVFSPDGGSQDLFDAAGINHHWLWPAVFRKECVPGRPQERFDRDVGFVGSTSVYHHEWADYRRRLLQHVKTKYRRRFGMWPENGPAVRGQDLNDLYASVPVIVGDSLCPGFDHPFYVSDRVFETVGRGGFIIHPFVEGLDSVFTDGETIVFYDYNDFDGLIDRIDHYLSNDEERERIRWAGHRLVKDQHTYTNRLMSALRTVSEGEGW